jgi:hypothetical protein
VVAMLVRYERDRIGSLGATVSDPLYGPGGTSAARIVGLGGGLAFDVATGRIDVQPSGGALERFTVDAPEWGLESAIRLELANFAAVIAGDAEPFVPPEEAFGQSSCARRPTARSGPAAAWSCRSQAPRPPARTNARPPAGRDLLAYATMSWTACWTRRTARMSAAAAPGRRPVSIDSRKSRSCSRTARSRTAAAASAS